MGSGLIPGNKRIQFLTNGDILNSASLENLRYHPSARTVHRIHCEFETGFCDQIEIGKPANGFGVWRRQVDFFDRGFLTFGHGPGGDFLFNHLHDGGGGRSAKFGFELYAIPVPRIVT